MKMDSLIYLDKWSPCLPIIYFPSSLSGRQSSKHYSQAGNFQTLQAGTSPASPADNTLSQAESAISQAGSTWSSQAGSSQSSPRREHSFSGQRVIISQAGSFPSFPGRQHSFPGRGREWYLPSRQYPGKQFPGFPSRQHSVLEWDLPGRQFPVLPSGQHFVSEWQSPRQALPSLPWWTALLLRQRVWPPHRQFRHSSRLWASQARNSQAGNSLSQAVPLGWTALSLSQTVMFPRWHLPRPVLPKKQRSSPLQ